MEKKKKNLKYPSFSSLFSSLLSLRLCPLPLLQSFIPE
jgi:hypothetical protein